MNEIIGRVTATEKYPATMDKFYFWTNADFRLNAFDVVNTGNAGRHNRIRTGRNQGNIGL